MKYIQLSFSRVLKSLCTVLLVAAVSFFWTKLAFSQPTPAQSSQIKEPSAQQSKLVSVLEDHSTTNKKTENHLAGDVQKDGKNSSPPISITPLLDASAYSILTSSPSANSNLVFGEMFESSLQDNGLTGKKVKRSISRGVKFLLSRKRNQRWLDLGQYKNGTTALVTLALLNSGVKPNDPEIVNVIDRLSRTEISKTYVVSLVTMVLANANPKKYQRQLQNNVNWLQKIQRNNGGWGYGDGGFGTDASNSQFAILALHEAQMAGIDVELETWQLAKRYWESVYYRPSGGFRYKGNSGSKVSGSMTCAGISSMVIINENLNLGSSQIKDGNVVCCGQSESDDMIEKSINWLGRHFRIGSNPGADGVHKHFVYYYKYSVERAGRLTGRRFFGRRDWYREIASRLVNPKIQQLNGSWIGRGASENDVIATSLSLLFLSKGLRPILASKYQYAEGNQWNRHPRGLHYLTRFTERVWQTKLNWQSIDGRKAKVNDLLETPVLMISGDGPMNLSGVQKERLKSYIDNGGFLFIEANRENGCPKAIAFNKEVRQMLNEWYPDAELKALSADHSVWTSQFQVKPRQKFALLGIESCCRTSVIYCTAPISGFWQLKTPASKRLPNPAAEDIEYASKLGVNILAFATGNILKDRLDRPKVDAEDQVSVLGRQMVVGKVQHNAGYNDAPAALTNLVRRANFEKGLQFNGQFKIVQATPKSIKDYPVLFIHGRGEIRFSKEQQKALAEHLENGGFIFGDAICGDKLFYDSFKKEILQIVEGSKWEKLGPEHPIFTQKYNGYQINNVTRRTRASRGKFVPAEVEMDGIKIGDRYQILFSQHDLSCALENGTSKSCYGYSLDDANRIGINILLYALHP